MPQVQDRSLHQLIGSPAHYHCVTDAPDKHNNNSTKSYNGRLEEVLNTSCGKLLNWCCLEQASFEAFLIDNRQNLRSWKNIVELGNVKESDR